LVLTARHRKRAVRSQDRKAYEREDYKPALDVFRGIAYKGEEACDSTMKTTQERFTRRVQRILEVEKDIYCGIFLTNPFQLPKNSLRSRSGSVSLPVERA